MGIPYGVRVPMTCECGAVTAYRACEACYEAELYGSGGWYRFRLNMDTLEWGIYRRYEDVFKRLAE